MEPGIETSRSGYVLETRVQPAGPTGRHGAGDREASSRNFQRVVKKQELGLVEGSTPSEAENQTAGRAGAGNVEALAPTARERNGDEEIELTNLVR
jgi:hypothetical protein